MDNDEWASAPFPRYTPAQEAEIVRRSPVVDVLRDSTTLTEQADGTHRGACPFCSRQDAFQVLPAEGRWRCAVCLETGDAMIFISKYRGLWRADAFKFLADRAKLNFGVGA